MRYLSFIVSLALSIGSCAISAKFLPEEKSLPAIWQRVPDITLEELKQGFAIYRTNCASCHRLHVPSEFDQGKWEKELNEMLPKAKITDPAIQKKLKDYLYAMAK